jgi:hypothetical protein
MSVKTRFQERIYNEGTLQQAQRAMRRRHRRLQSQDPVAYAATEARRRQRLCHANVSTMLGLHARKNA